MQKDSKNQRRKRKDEESRDFMCACGKSYLSYAAAYTHVKNKHNLQKDYVENIQKPAREQLRRGRPKEKKENNQTFQTSFLTLIESSILKICTQIQQNQEKIILQGNQERDQAQFQGFFEALCKEKEDSLAGIDNYPNQQIIEFINKLNKDFVSKIAAKIKLTLIVIINMLESSNQQEKNIMRKLNQLRLWGDHNSIHKIIIDTYWQWQQLQKSKTNAHDLSQ